MFGFIEELKAAGLVAGDLPPDPAQPATGPG